MNKIEIWLDLTGAPIIHKNYTSTYQKGSFFCVYKQNTQTVYKYPVDHIFRIIESYLDNEKRSDI